MCIAAYLQQLDRLQNNKLSTKSLIIAIEEEGAVICSHVLLFLLLNHSAPVLYSTGPVCVSLDFRAFLVEKSSPPSSHKAFPDLGQEVLYRLHMRYESEVSTQEIIRREQKRRDTELQQNWECNYVQNYSAMGMIKLQQLKLLGMMMFVIALQVSRGTCDESFGTADGTEQWGYTDVREGAHLFWWLYYKDVSSVADAPLVMWLQGGPGASGVGFGNFEEVGPLYTNLTERESTWLKLVHLLFVDNPVGTGFSYVDDPSLLTTTNKQVSDDLIEFLKSFFRSHEALKKSPFYIVAESYGGKYASELGVSIYKAMAEGGLDFNFQGVALGDTWISPTDFLLAWGPLLKAVSLVDEAGNDYLNSIAELAVDELAKGHCTNSTYLWGDLEDAVLELTDDVDFYYFLRHETESSPSRGLRKGLGARHLKRFAPDPLEVVMNGPIREKLSIIPSFVRWGQSSGSVFKALTADFMLDTIDKVDELLALGVDVTVYSGQYVILLKSGVSNVEVDNVFLQTGFDLLHNWNGGLGSETQNGQALYTWLCTTGSMTIANAEIGALISPIRSRWWPGLASFNMAKRTPLYCGGGQTQAFVKKYENLTFYWILNAGHMVPTDNPCGALKLLSLITKQGSAVEMSDEWNILSPGGLP